MTQITYEIRSMRGRVVEVFDDKARAQARISDQRATWGLNLRLFEVRRDERDVV